MRFFGLSVAIYFAAYGLLVLVQRSLIYFPDRDKPDLASSAISGMELARVETADGLMLESWYRAPSDAMPTIVMFHGNAGNHGMRSYSMRPFADAGYGIMLASYRGYGGNPGSPSEDGLYADGRAHVRWLMESAGTAPEQIVLYGESLGSGVAVQMAGEYGVAALILQTPFDSLAHVAQMQMFFFPFVRTLTWDKFDNDAKIGALTLPTLIMIAGNDEVIPARSSSALIAAARDGVSVVHLKGASHNTVFSNGAHKAVMAFLTGHGLPPSR